VKCDTLHGLKVLLLGSSDDTGSGFVGGKRRQEILRDLLAEEFGEPVSVVVRSPWPDLRMAALVERWLTENDPDLVYLNITTFPFSYESLPLRVGRLLGPFGGRVRETGLRMADSKRWAHNAVFRTARRWAQTAIGGDTHFTCDEVITRYSEVIRLVSTRELTCLIVKGPQRFSASSTAPRARQRREAKRLYVQKPLKALCDELHVDYYGRESPTWTETMMPGGTLGDGIHSNAQGHAVLAAEWYRTISTSWSRHIAQ
jgi:hypothetical protein